MPSPRGLHIPVTPCGFRLKFTDYCNRICGTNLERKQENGLADLRPKNAGTAEGEEPRAAGLGAKVGVSFTYVSRIENENLDFGPYPSDALIGKLAKALEADEDELLLLAKKIPRIGLEESA